MEQIRYLDSPDAPALRLVRYLPAAPAEGLVLLVPPFAEENKAACRALVEAARALAAAGLEAVRVDLSGTGDSGGEHGAATVDRWLADLRAVLDETAAGRPVTLLGLRLGAALAWRLAEDARVTRLIAWEPIVSGASHMRQNRQRSQLRSELTGGEASLRETSEEAFPGFDFDGFPISSELHRGLAELDLLAEPTPQLERALVLQVSGSSRLKRPFEKLAERLSEGGAAVELDHVAVEAFWSAVGLVDTGAVRDRTLHWLGVTANEPPEPALDAPGGPVEIDDGVTVSAVTLPSGEQWLTGVLYRPATEPSRQAVVLLHGWSGYRIGPGRLLTRAARELAFAGYPTLSFDFRGRGESGWEVSQASLNSMIRDAARAAAWLKERGEAESVTLLGLCSGAEVAIGASLSDPAIDGLVLWSAPIFSGNFDFARRARRSRKMATGYLRKLFLPETWAKLFGGRLNWKMIVRALSGGRSAEDAGVVDKAPETEAQMAAFEAFDGRLLFVYGGNDPETAPSREFYRSFVERTKMAHMFVEVPGANHNFYSSEWQGEVIAATLGWLGGKAEGMDR